MLDPVIHSFIHLYTIHCTLYTIHYTLIHYYFVKCLISKCLFPLFKEIIDVLINTKLSGNSGKYVRYNHL